MLSVGAFYGETMTVRKALIERRRLHDKYQAIADRYQQSIKDNEETTLKGRG